MRIFKFWIAVAGFLGLGLATLYALALVFFCASEPTNYGAMRFKVYAWLCVIALPVELIGFFWTVSRIYKDKSMPPREPPAKP